MDKFAWLRSLRGADLTHAEFRVLVNLCTYADADSGQAYPSNSTLAEASAVNPKVLTRDLIPALRQKGWIRLVAPGGNQNGRGRANVWKLSFPHAVKGVPHVPPSPSQGGTSRTPLGSNEGGTSRTARGYLTYPEGGTSRTPHQVIDQPMNRSESSSHLSNAGAGKPVDSDKPQDSLSGEVPSTGRFAPDEPETAPIERVEKAVFGLTDAERTQAEDLLASGETPYRVIVEIRARRTAAKRKAG